MYFYCIAYSAGYISALLCRCPRCSVWGLVCMFFLSQCVCVCLCFFPSFFVLFFCITVCYISSSNKGGQLDGLIPFWQPAYYIVLTDLTCIWLCVWLINSLYLSLPLSDARATINDMLGFLCVDKTMPWQRHKFSLVVTRVLRLLLQKILEYFFTTRVLVKFYLRLQISTPRFNFGKLN